MAKYNSGIKYNFRGNKGGTLYNSARYVLIIKISEVIHADDSVRNLVVKNIIRENANVFEDAINYTFRSFSEKFAAKDRAFQLRLVQVAEKVGIMDSFTDLIVSLYIKEKANVLNEIKELSAKLEQKEEFPVEDFNDVSALITLADDLQLKEASKLFAKIKQFEYAKATDHKPRTAESDFLIGYADGLDRAFEWFLPLEMFVDPDETELQVMPQAESTYIELPCMDGSIWENTVYKNRFFNIVAWSKDGLTTYEKEQLKADITRVLDSTKNQTKRLTIQKSGTAFDVKYSGALSLREGPSFIKASIPFEMPPYGYPLFSQTVHGTGLLVNGGDADVGFINEITGACTNPGFQIGSIVYKWTGTIPEGSKLVLNHENLTCYLEDANGNKTNAISKLEGEFQQIKQGTTIQITAFEGTESHLKTTLTEKILWKRR